MKLDFNQPFVNLDGEIFKDADKQDLNLGVILGTQLALSKEGSVLKKFGWAIKLNNKETLDLDKADQQYLKEFIESHKDMTILLKGRLLEVFDK